MWAKLSYGSRKASLYFWTLWFCVSVFLLLYLLYITLWMAWPCGIGPLHGVLTNYCPSVLDTVGWVI